MDILNAGEALFIACEMERRAIRLYERALVVFDGGPCQTAIKSILCDERRHLEQFSAMGGQTPGFERARLLAAEGAKALFSGGLVEAQRKGAFTSPHALYAYAAEEEKEAIRYYGEFALRFGGETGVAFFTVKAEEEKHLRRLEELLES